MHCYSCCSPALCRRLARPPTPVTRCPLHPLAAFLEAHAAELVGAAVKTLPDSSAPDAARALQRFAEVGVAGSETLLKTLAGAVVKHEKAKPAPHVSGARDGQYAML